MKNLCLIILFLFNLSIYAQNIAPIANNDTVSIKYNDSLIVTQKSGTLTPNGPPFLTNDTDPDGNVLFIDNAFYNGNGSFSFIYDKGNNFPTNIESEFNYFPPLNFWGMDSIKYTIRDNEIPFLYDTATLYIMVQRKEFENLDLNNINARIENGTLFNNSRNSTPEFEVPKGNKQNTIFAANLWLTGTNQNQVFSSSKTYDFDSRNRETYRYAGPIMDAVYYNENYDSNWDRLWKISQQEINRHRNNWKSPNYQPIEAIAEWPAHGDTSKGQAYYLAPFIDFNNDGKYNPLDGDYPQIKGQQAIYSITNDMRASDAFVSPMKTEIHTMVYAYDCPTDSAINNTIFLDYTLYNRSNLTYDSTYIGMWSDFDIGGAADDYDGCDVDRSTFYAYNGDSDDEGRNGLLGYGTHTPAQGVTFLKGAKQDNDGRDNNFGINKNETINGLGFNDGIADNEYWGMEHFMGYNLAAQFLGDGDPQSAHDYYNYLNGNWRLGGAQMVYGGNGNAISTGGTVPAKYLYPGNSDKYWYSTGGIPQTPWTEGNANAGSPNLAGDRRGVGSTGPFTFMPDSSVEVTLAFVFGRDYQTPGNEAGIVVMQERVDSIRSYYLNDFSSICGGTVSISENNIEDINMTTYPNPFNNILTVNYELTNNSGTLEVYNAIGENIITKEISKNITKIDLSDQPKGIFFINIVDNNTRVSKKVVKQ